MSSDEDEPDPDNNLMTARPPPGSGGSDVYSASTVATQAPAGLLDLVRDAEEAAKLGATETAASGRGATASKTPTSATKFHAARPLDEAPSTTPSPGTRTPERSREEIVDVDDDAIDAPPSLPPFRSPTPDKAFRPAKVNEGNAEQHAQEKDEAAPASKAVRRKTPRPREALSVDEARDVEVGRANKAAPAKASPPTALPSPSQRSLPPAIAIMILFALAIGALALTTR